MTRAPFNADDDDAGAPARNELACEASGCPNRWTSRVDAGNGIGLRRLCHAHSVAPPRLWSLITDAQLRAAADLPPELQREPVDAEAVAHEKARLATLRAELTARPTPAARAWAIELRERERQGKTLTKPQRSAWREVLGEASAQ
jgi:hypothetical protein